MDHDESTGPVQNLLVPLFGAFFAMSFLSLRTNSSAPGILNQSRTAELSLQKTISRLTTGLRVQSAADDPAGISLAAQLRADGAVAAQGRRNVADGTSLLQVASGALQQVNQALARASQLAEEARTGTVSDAQRVSLDKEFQTLVQEVSNLGSHTLFNGQPVFGGSLTVAAGQMGAVDLPISGLDAADPLHTYQSTFGASGTTNPSQIQLEPAGALPLTITSGTPLSLALPTPLDGPANGHEGQVQITVNDAKQPFQISYTSVPTQTASLEPVALSGSTVNLAHSEVSRLTFQDASGADLALTEGTDYTLDRTNGTLTVLDAAAFAQVASASYQYVPASPVTSETLALTGAGTANLAHVWASRVVVKDASGTVLTPGTDYTLDAQNGRLTFLNPASLSQPLTADYEYIPTVTETGSYPTSRWSAQSISGVTVGSTVALAHDNDLSVSLYDQPYTLTQGINYTLDAASGTFTLGDLSAFNPPVNPPLQVSYSYLAPPDASHPAAYTAWATETLPSGLTSGSQVLLQHTGIQSLTAYDSSRPLVNGTNYSFDPSTGQVTFLDLTNMRQPFEAYYSYWPPLQTGETFALNPNASAMLDLTQGGNFTSANPVIQDSSVPPNTLMMGTDFTLDLQRGTVTILNPAFRTPLHLTWQEIPTTLTLGEAISPTTLQAGDVAQLKLPWVAQVTSLTERPPITLTPGTDYALPETRDGVLMGPISIFSPQTFPGPLTVTYQGVSTLGLVAGQDNLLTAANAASVEAKLPAAIQAASRIQGQVGAGMEALMAYGNTLDSLGTGFTAGESQIRDADVATEIIALTRAQIMTQADAQALRASTDAGQQVLQLLR